ncbi:MAG: hypothetical protein N3B01_04400 [Verrucomicrobiae bacterium]|nr:hypothetical protein [Verrucomicrobiae bacterium]
MRANFLPVPLEKRAEEMDFVTRIVRTRMQSLKYLLHGTWLRPSSLDVPQKEIDVGTLSTFAPLKESMPTDPVALAGAWRAPDGDGVIALANISQKNLNLRLPIPAKACRLKDDCAMYRTDASERRRIGKVSRNESVVQTALFARLVYVLEFCPR